jgi:hypothetical protein
MDMTEVTCCLFLCDNHTIAVTTTENVNRGISRKQKLHVPADSALGYDETFWPSFIYPYIHISNIYNNMMGCIKPSYLFCPRATST